MSDDKDLLKLDEIQTILNLAGNDYDVPVSENVGLNSDWSVSAWMVSPGEPNRTDGAMYIIDNENGKAQLVRRNMPDSVAYEGADPVEVIESAHLSKYGLRKLVEKASRHQ